MLKFYNYDIVFQEIPNEVTLAINITNCPNNCKGCHSAHLQKDVGEVLDEEQIVFIMGEYSDAITCFCFMGGDSDPYRVAELADFVRKKYPEVKTAWYSGKEDIPEKFDTKSFHFIKLGPYMEQYGPLGKETCNQHLYKVQQDGSMVDVSYLFRVAKDHLSMV